ncbi:hypothetical protein TVAG_109510 [Trichomonas vaginalis G3]|uniref:TOG domain-containing protein n=1 Tax=Trichomonas vaginalis (strain ATCC PRA-98 / G3) TaxID=412133 RepID=A2EAE0_TRIV3|nr:microtubule plus end polymerase family [Trichomonas vaginalis G3]EAY10367.1 hypothetical protein TVAG_109510 [Trichomonas vaginalis G3]KAI5485350.1 microtubule plus end polymerase family [Trichomonas vaginalis G3]|eukprot:XP_001322590.1 hypothetical protein [Trichomonas vaginalis G3]
MTDEVPEKDYDLSNLPPEAFADPNPGAQVVEEDNNPIIYSLPLNKRKFTKDTEPDECGEPSISKDAATKSLSLLIGNDFNLLKNRAFKNKIKGLNALQNILGKECDLDSNADAIYRGLEAIIGWKERIAAVNSLLIDVFRTVLVKSNNIKKATVAIIIPFLIDKLSDRALKDPSSELLEMIAQAICPSFVLLHAGKAIAALKNGKVQASALEVLVNIVKKFGIGSISIEHFLPVLISLLQNTNTAVKTPAIVISTYIYKQLGETFQKQLESLPESVQSTLSNEFKNAENLPAPTEKFYRTSDNKALEELAKLNEQLNKEKAAEDAAKAKISNVITPEVLAAAEAAQKFKDFDEFFKTIDGAIAEMPYVMTSDLGPVMALFKNYMTKSDRIILNTFTTLAKIAQKADGDFDKYARLFAPFIVQKWTDFNEHSRDIVTATVNAFLPKSGTTPFVDALSKTVSDPKFQSSSRLTSLAWMESAFQQFTPGDIEKLKIIVQSFMNDKVANVRKEAQKLLDMMGVPQKPKEDAIPQKSIKEIPQSPITRNVRKSKRISVEKKDPNESSVMIQKEKEVEKPQVVDVPRFSQATQSKKQKRLAILIRVGSALIANKQNIIPFSDKCKLDASNHLPQTFTTKLFSNQMNEQLKALEEMNQFFQGNESSFYNTSDIFLRWLIIKLFDKNIKVVLDGFQFMSKLYCDNNPMTSQEMDMIIPIIFWCMDNKSQQIVDAALDLLVIIRLHSDINEYSLSLRSCIPGATNQVLIHIFSELQLCVGENSSNREVFYELMGYTNNSEVGVSAACGGVLALIAKNMSTEQKLNLFSSFTKEQIEFLTPFIPINMSEEVLFNSFADSSQSEKAHILRVLVQQLSTNPDSIDAQAQSIAEQLSKELMQTEANYSIIKPALYVLHEITNRFEITQETLQEELGSICFVATYFNRSLKAIDGIAQMINSLIYKLFEKLPAQLSFIALMRSMESVEEVTDTSFFAKAFVVLISSVVDRDAKELDEARKYLSQQLNHLQNSNAKQLRKGDVRVQLIQAAIQAITQKAAPEVTMVSKKSSRLSTTSTTASAIASHVAALKQKNEETTESKRVPIKSAFQKNEETKQGVTPRSNKKERNNSLFDDSISTSNIVNSPNSRSKSILNNSVEASEILSPTKSLNESMNKTQNESFNTTQNDSILSTRRVLNDSASKRMPRKSLNNNENKITISALPKEDQSPVQITRSPYKVLSPAIEAPISSRVSSPRDTNFTPTKKSSIDDSLLNTPSPMKKASEMPASPKISPMKSLQKNKNPPKEENVTSTILTPTKNGGMSPTRLEIISQTRGSPVAQALSTALSTSTKEKTKKTKGSSSSVSTNNSTTSSTRVTEKAKKSSLTTSTNSSTTTKAKARTSKNSTNDTTTTTKTAKQLAEENRANMKARIAYLREKWNK